jgi:hypothetical protein
MLNFFMGMQKWESLSFRLDNAFKSYEGFFFFFDF